MTRAREAATDAAERAGAVVSSLAELRTGRSKKTGNKKSKDKKASKSPKSSAKSSGKSSSKSSGKKSAAKG